MKCTLFLYVTSVNMAAEHVPIPQVGECPGAPMKVEPTRSAFGGFGAGIPQQSFVFGHPVAFGSNTQIPTPFFITPPSAKEQRETKLVKMLSKICSMQSEASSMKMMDEIEIILRHQKMMIDTVIINNLKRKRDATK